MIILGINFSIDAASSLLIDGKIVAAQQEERFKRIKHYAGFPEDAINFCLESQKLSWDDIDAISFFWNPLIQAEPFHRRFSSIPRHHLEFLYNLPNNILRMSNFKVGDFFETNMILATGKKIPIFYVRHHLCHAASAFFRSPFKESAILTIDGYGEKDSTMICKGFDNNIEPVWHQEFPHSLGSYYASFTQFLGFKPNAGEGKFMGLASYGENSFYDEIKKIVKLQRDGFELDLSYFNFYLERTRRFSRKFIQIFGDERVLDGEITKRDMDIAKSAQSVLEDAMLHLVKLTKQKVNSKNLCLAGGVALNCCANGKIIENKIFENHYIQPASSDAGASMGSALYLYHCIFGKNRNISFGLDYLGPYYADDKIEKELKKSGLTYKKENYPEEKVAELLTRGYIGSVFQGNAEFGPRALGNRSTLADARIKNMKDILNSRVKFREPFRPYAPSVLEERMREYFEGEEQSPFMLRVYRTRDDKVQEVPAITHVDGGARVQSVNKSQNEFYYNIIKCFEKKTGTPLILNTSFNIRGEPIVNTPSDAIKCYITTGMDFLLIGSFLLTKENVHL